VAGKLSRQMIKETAVKLTAIMLALQGNLSASGLDTIIPGKMLTLGCSSMESIKLTMSHVKSNELVQRRLLVFS
jgi:hypothetical protein